MTKTPPYRSVQLACAPHVPCTSFLYIQFVVRMTAQAQDLHPEPGCCSFDTPALAMMSVVAPTLRTHGPAFTEGGVLHPHGCTPCAFYCYKQGGCWKDTACTYCHMMHVSNHRMRRDEWKKRRSRDRVATDLCAVYNTVPADTPCYISLSGGCCVLHA